MNKIKDIKMSLIFIAFITNTVGKVKLSLIFCLWSDMRNCCE